jgi:folylpolyglutamate synthase/dihydropteroate synthase
LPKKRSYKDRNVSLATAIADACGVTQDAIQKGVEATRMQCRFEVIADAPLVILDGAHNRAKMQTTVKNLSEYAYKKLILVCAIANTNKDSEAVIKQVIPLADTIILGGTIGTDRKSMHPSQLEPLVRKYIRKGVKVRIVEKPADAMCAALKVASKKDCVLVTGSFFLAGEVRKEWYPEHYILAHQKSF